MNLLNTAVANVVRPLPIATQPRLGFIGTGWIGRLLTLGGDIPYGVAIAAGALLAWPYSTLMTTAF